MPDDNRKTVRIEDACWEVEAANAILQAAHTHVVGNGRGGPVAAWRLHMACLIRQAYDKHVSAGTCVVDEFADATDAVANSTYRLVDRYGEPWRHADGDVRDAKGVLMCNRCPCTYNPLRMKRMVASINACMGINPKKIPGIILAAAQQPPRLLNPSQRMNWEECRYTLVRDMSRSAIADESGG